MTPMLDDESDDTVGVGAGVGEKVMDAQSSKLGISGQLLPSFSPLYAEE